MVNQEIIQLRIETLLHKHLVQELDEQLLRYLQVVSTRVRFQTTVQSVAGGQIIGANQGMGLEVNKASAIILTLLNQFLHWVMAEQQSQFRREHIIPAQFLTTVQSAAGGGILEVSIPRDCWEMEQPLAKIPPPKLPVWELIAQQLLFLQVYQIPV